MKNRQQVKNNDNDNDDDLLFTFKSNTSLSSSLESFSRTIMKPFPSSGSSSFDRNTYLASKGAKFVHTTHRHSTLDFDLFVCLFTFIKASSSTRNTWIERSKSKRPTTILVCVCVHDCSIRLFFQTVFDARLQLGLSVDSNHDEGQNGCKIVKITENSAAHRDGRLAIGDYILAVNNENMRNITNATAKSVLKRASLVSTDIMYVCVCVCS
jgi:hypothetical protein